MANERVRSTLAVGRRFRGGPAAVDDTAAGPHQARGHDAEGQHAERAVRRAAVPFQIG